MMWILVLAAFAASVVMTDLVRRYALHRAILDVPNHRSSHVVPTPRGGGLAIAVVTLGGSIVAALLGLISAPFAIALVGGGFLVAAVGWLDDRRGVNAAVRFGVHLVAAIWAVAWLGGLPTLRVGEGVVSLSWFGWIVSTLLVVWLLNLYNFMDGIDGIAGGEALLVGGIGGALALLSGDTPTATVALLTAAGAAGFLVWNWPPAKIFMGDVGSGLLGFLFAVVAIHSEHRGRVSLLIWCVLLGVFLVDATVTLSRRILRGERWYEAHHSHAYQRVVQAGWAHRRSTLATMVLTLLLGILASAMVFRPALVPFGVLVGLTLPIAAYYGAEKVRPMAPPARQGRMSGAVAKDR